MIDSARYIFRTRPDVSPVKDAALKGGTVVIGGTGLGVGIYATIEWAKSFITAENATTCLNATLAAALHFQGQLANWTQTCTSKDPLTGEATCNLTTVPKYVEPNCPTQESGLNIPLIVVATSTAISGLLLVRSAIVSYDQRAVPGQLRQYAELILDNNPEGGSYFGAGDDGSFVLPNNSKKGYETFK